MERLLVVDGMNLLFQMFYGMPTVIPDSKGRPIQGTLGFVGALLRILRMVHPSHVVVLFDGEGSNPRCSLDETYKANRPDYCQMAPEEVPFCQLPDVYRALEYLNICHCETTECEADDWIAGYAIGYGKEMEIVIASQDSDLWQLITERVRILRYRGERTVICDQAWLQEKLGIAPSQYGDFKCMTGDPSDNIRGAELIGPKTAASLLRQFETLEKIIDRADEIQRPSIRASIQRNAERLRCNQRLICLQGTQTLPFDLQALRWEDGGHTTMQVLGAIGLQRGSFPEKNSGSAPL